MSKLDGMTWERWQSLTPAQKDKLRDTSALHPKLKGLEGYRVRVSPKREFGKSTFRVGRTTGWRPVHLAVRGNAHSSSDLIRSNEQFNVTVL